MKITFIYPAFERHAQAHPQLRQYVPCDEYLGPPSLGIASVAAMTPERHQVEYLDDRITPFDPEHEADLFALSFFTPAATRALEIGDALRVRGKKVVMGGIFPTAMPEVAGAHCDTVVLGEGEPVWARLLEDAERGQLLPEYRSDQPADLEQLPPPRVELYLEAERDGHRPDDYPIQVSRGCPLFCDACVLPLVMGKKIRFHSPANLATTMRTLARANKQMSFTEDTSALPFGGARRRFRQFLDLCLTLRNDGVPVRYSYLGISLPMILNLEETLLEQLRQTGIDRFYVVGGFDPITRKAFGTGDQEALGEAENAVKRCRECGIDPYLSFLVGNPDDDESIFDRILEFTRRAGVDLAEFCVATPYPGTPLWQRYQREDRIFDTTWKHYNDANVVFRPHRMSAGRLQEGYFYLWREFYAGRRSDLDSRMHNRRTIQF